VTILQMKRVSTENNEPSSSSKTVRREGSSPDLLDSKNLEILPEEIPGKEIGDFDCMRKLARGAFGTILKVRSRLDQRVYVLKQIQVKGLGVNKQKSALQEVLILRRLSHPCITKYITAFLDHSSLYIVMEYMEGGDCHQLVQKLRKRQRILKEDTVWCYFKQVCSGLAYLHERRFLHRDIKAMNILLSAMNDAKIADLGISCSQSKDRDFRGQAGTPLFLAPEVVKSAGYDSKADMWCLGCFIYNMAALKPPFNPPKNSYNRSETLRDLILFHDPAKIPKFYSNGLWHAVQYLLNKKPSARPSAQELLRKISELEFEDSRSPVATNYGFMQISLPLSNPEKKRTKISAPFSRDNMRNRKGRLHVRSLGVRGKGHTSTTISKNQARPEKASTTKDFQIGARSQVPVSKKFNPHRRPSTRSNLLTDSESKSLLEKPLSKDRFHLIIKEHRSTLRNHIFDSHDSKSTSLKKNSNVAGGSEVSTYQQLVKSGSIRALGHDTRCLSSANENKAVHRSKTLESNLCDFGRNANTSQPQSARRPAASRPLRHKGNSSARSHSVNRTLCRKNEDDYIDVLQFRPKSSGFSQKDAPGNLSQRSNATHAKGKKGDGHFVRGRNPKSSILRKRINVLAECKAQLKSGQKAVTAQSRSVASRGIGDRASAQSRSTCAWSRQPSEGARREIHTVVTLTALDQHLQKSLLIKSLKITNARRTSPGLRLGGHKEHGNKNEFKARDVVTEKVTRTGWASSCTKHISPGKPSSDFHHQRSKQSSSTLRKPTVEDLDWACEIEDF